MSWPHSEPLPLGGAEALLRERIAGLLEEARQRTRTLVEPLSDDGLNQVHDPLMSPLAWDLGHIAAFEDLWLCQRAGGLRPLRADLERVYDATETPRPGRGELPYLRAEDARAYMDAVRARSLTVLEDVELSPSGDRLNAHGFVWDMVVQHEHQHNETMIQTLALAEAGTYAPKSRPWPVTGTPGEEMTLVEAGPFLAGAGECGFAYDCERPRHEVDVDAFWIDRTPVTNGAYLEFVESGGYRRREWWSDEGWTWKLLAGVERPLYWTADGGERRFDRTVPIDPSLPVMHVSCHEAEAFARSRGKRLPTELEWEKAAAWGPGLSVPRRFPWGDRPPTAGHANLDQLAWGPAPAGAYPAGASAYGVLGLIGDAWEWTASELVEWPGFAPFPYEEYSGTFMGQGYRVLRGGSWATRPRVVRNTCRNWDFPERRQIFTGFRCARGT